MDIGKKAINGFVWFVIFIYGSGVVIIGTFKLYDFLKVLLGYPSIIGGH